MRKTSPLFDLPLFLAALPAALFATGAKAGGDEDFGCTVRHNIQVQVVDMDPKYAGTLMEGGVGQRSAAAVRRYMTDNVRALARVDGRSDVGQQGGASKSADPSGGGSGGEK